MQSSELFEVRIGRGWPLLANIGGERLFALDAVADGKGCHSEDGGRTWGEPFEIRRAGQPGSGQLINTPTGDLGLVAPFGGGIVSLTRTSSGKLAGLLYEPGPPELVERYRYRAWTRISYVTSEDEGRMWSEGVLIAPPSDSFAGVNGLIQLSTGRLLAALPMILSDYSHPEYQGEGTVDGFRGGYGTYQGRRMLVEGHRHTPEFEAIVIFYSDDDGQTWRSGPNMLWVWPLPVKETFGPSFGPHSNLDEPTPVELSDGRILILCRTVTGRMYQSISEDGGVNWSIPEPTELASSDSPCDVRRIPGTDDLVVTWNQLSGDEILRGLKRARMCCAISTDDGKTWKNFKTLEAFGGLPEVGKIEPPPIGTYHSHDNVGEIPVDFGVAQYPCAAFVGDTVLFGYSINEMRPLSEWTDETPIYGLREAYGKIKAFPISWLYE